MRMWKGIEREGAQKGVDTLFVESAHILVPDLFNITDNAKKHGISRIYLGAGRKDILFLCKEWATILSDFNVVVETSCKSLGNLTKADKFKSIILRNDICLKDYSNVVPKVDNGESVTLYYGKVTNRLDTLEGGIYTDSDKLIYSK